MSDEDAKPKRGRPRAVEPGAAVATWLSAGEYDRLIQIARKQDTTVSSLMRAMVRRDLLAVRPKFP